MKMRIPTNKEYDRLVDLTDGANDKMHWKDMFSWVDDVGAKHCVPSDYRTVRGEAWVRYQNYYHGTNRGESVGFRPAVEIPGSSTLVSDAHDGEPVVIGTLYMGDKPVIVPKKPTWNGDISAYVPGAKLEMREALDDPAYQVAGIRVGDAFIADRVLLRDISYEDIEKALFRSYVVTETCPHCESEIKMRWNTDTMGFKAFCPVCGQRLMLCDECRHCPNAGPCDYDSGTDSCKRSVVVPEG